MAARINTRVKLTQGFYPGIKADNLVVLNMSDLISKSCTAFVGDRLLLSGPLAAVALAVKAAAENGKSQKILVFDDATGRVIDLDLRGPKADIIERLYKPSQSYLGRYRPAANEGCNPAKHEISKERGRGRPKLGVVAREVTLLPRQWEWLATQPGGASAVLRRLVDDARRSGGTRQQKRTAQDAAYQFMLAMAGDLPGYEEATRALFADDRRNLEQRIVDWPQDIRSHALRLTLGTQDHPTSPKAE
jgi:hypothetical protein